MNNKENKKEDIKEEKKNSVKKTSEKASKDKSKEMKDEKKQARMLKKSLKARAFRRGWFSVALVVFFIAAVVIVNMIAQVLVEKVPALNIDMTGENSFELTETTTDYLRTLSEDITLYILADESDYKDGGEYYIQANTLLHAYEDSCDRITAEYVDLASNPTFTQKYPDEDLKNFNIIVQGKDSYEYLEDTDIFEYNQEYLYTYGYYIAEGCNIEEAVTSAILNVTLKEKPKVTFVSDVTEEDYSAFKNLLDKNGFETDEVSPSIGTIPEDTSVVVLYAPTIDLDSEFVDSLNDFLVNGGNYGKQLLYFPTYKLIDLPNIDSLVEEWGMQVEMGYAIEQDPNYLANNGGYYIFAAQYPEGTEYTANMKNANIPVCFIEGATRAVNVLDDSYVSSLLTLSDKAQTLYAESVETPDSAESDEMQASEPVASPNCAVAAIATKTVVGSESSDSDTGTDSDSSSDIKESNLIVIASSYAASSSSLSRSTYGNSSYLLSLLNTVTGRDNVGVTIESKSLAGTELGITSAQLYSLGILFVIIIPVAVLIAGIVVFIKRKNM